MNAKLRWMFVACCCFMITGMSDGQEIEDKSQTKYYLNVSSEKDGVKEEVSKTYDSRQVMEEDPFFEDLGIELPKGEHQKLVLETTKDDKKISLSTMMYPTHRERNVSWMHQDDDVEVAIIKNGKSIKTIRSTAPRSGKKVLLGVPAYQRDVDFDTGSGATMYKGDRQVEVFAFEKDEDGHIQMDQEEAQETIERLEKLIEALKASQDDKD
ncbi:hypothetical protein Echvi_1294 [Echinicola vietnamensis DSM 17526]|uniref:Uncharacterized protein n=2 Tax=Echinicola TaxID=390846 RepID=L0FY60_ECHVK|nr:hypothetical protein Echvi_1294 [Echinicola vietnamensis DSM 17526]